MCHTFRYFSKCVIYYSANTLLMSHHLEQGLCIFNANIPILLVSSFGPYHTYISTINNYTYTWRKKALLWHNFLSNVGLINVYFLPNPYAPNSDIHLITLVSLVTYCFSLPFLLTIYPVNVKLSTLLFRITCFRNSSYPFLILTINIHFRLDFA